jgi:hydrogenase maturation protease
MQSFPISGVVVVFTPQNLVEMIVRKAVSMARKMEKRVLGIVENMSFLYLSDSDKRIEIFGRSRGEEMAQTVNAPLLAKIPIDPQLARLCDEGKIENFESNIVTRLGDRVDKLVTS